MEWEANIKKLNIKIDFKTEGWYCKMGGSVNYMGGIVKWRRGEWY